MCVGRGCRSKLKLPFCREKINDMLKFTASLAAGIHIMTNKHPELMNLANLTANHFERLLQMLLFNSQRIIAISKIPSGRRKGLKY